MQSNKLDPNVKDRFPLYSLSFSPNWNSAQIICCNSKGVLAYGANEEIFLIDTENRSFITSLSCPQQKKTNENKPLKVTCIFIDESILVAGYSDGTISYWNLKINYECIIYFNTAYISISHIMPGLKYKENMSFIVSNELGTIYEINIDEGKIIQKVIKEKGGAMSLIKLVQSYIFSCNKEGVLEIFDYIQNKSIYINDLKSKIVSNDTMISKDSDQEIAIKISLMSKKNILSIIDIKFDPNEQHNSDKINVKILSTKLSFQIEPQKKNDKDVLKAINCIKLLDSDRVITSFLNIILV